DPSTACFARDPEGILVRFALLVSQGILVRLALLVVPGRERLSRNPDVMEGCDEQYRKDSEHHMEAALDEGTSKDDRLSTNCQEEMVNKLALKHSDSSSASEKTTSQSSIHLLDQMIPPIIAPGNLEVASKISDQSAQRNYENTMREAIERKEYDERKQHEELKAKKKKPKLKWG
ncbi:15227_t:CDS:2, partial [Cetraspora pellucida]